MQKNKKRNFQKPASTSRPFGTSGTSSATSESRSSRGSRASSISSESESLSPTSESWSTKPSKPSRTSSKAKSYKTANGPKQAKSPRSNTSQHIVKEPIELLQFLLLTRSDLGRNSVKSILARGQVSVNDRVVKAYNFPLEPGNTVTISMNRIVEKQPLVGLNILHEDDDIIVVRKEAGLLSVASEQENEVTAYRQLMAHVRSKDSNSRIFIVHRLDRDTSGVMLFAKSEKVQQHLQNTWQVSVKERSYVALVEGWVRKTEGTITSWLRESSTMKMYSSSRPNDGLHAVTHYKTIQTNKAFTLLEVVLETGRKNQIRVHMEDIGHPIVGDKKYGSKSRIIGRLGLHARVLAFEHPTTGKIMRFETDIPKMFLGPFRQTDKRS
ncbi:RluA family pseudouridine synthase [Paenibacillus sp. GSMTC-2017]|uniref:RluA family pseudouridine synthase n=1 Tax=Paenibacillus sp. GSMTC-2017 TaxID=2794350 RepID=UPI0018D7DFCF|nr:RluA family pseudouridine synthase [Paenibacillus sp. GSMTC-2017]MBH5320463.1 RluA family pseudouridine synthase [Paenibacillus sp. GSMTC-2017]